MDFTDFVEELKRALELDIDIDNRLVLDVAREAAHLVERPAAPVSTFLLGYAAAQAGGSREEVQRLAERSAEATKQIASLIRTIQSDTQDAVAAMERSTQNVVEGTRLSDEAGTALGDIGSVSRQLAELIEDISATASRQAASAGTVAQSIQRILLVTEQTSEGTQQTAGSIRQLSGLAQELKGSVSRFKVQ